MNQLVSLFCIRISKYFQKSNLEFSRFYYIYYVEGYNFYVYFQIRMEPVKSLLVFLLILLACSKSSSQINFSTNWGSGKRSGSMFGQRESDVTCFAKLEYNLLKNLVDIIQVCNLR